ncbi:Sodium/potassium/calcium exchanger [Dirofilaria immitis]
MNAKVQCIKNEQREREKRRGREKGREEGEKSFSDRSYDHEATKEAHVKDDNHSGFEKGYEHIGADHGSAHSVWDKITLGEDSDEHAHNHGDWKQAFQYLDKNFSAFLYFA